MSADKHKKRDRAYAFLRRLKRWPGNQPLVETYANSRDRPSMEWLVKKGLGMFKRRPYSSGLGGYTLRRNYFIEK